MGLFLFKMVDIFYKPAMFCIEVLRRKSSLLSICAYILSEFLLKTAA